MNHREALGAILCIEESLVLEIFVKNYIPDKWKVPIKSKLKVPHLDCKDYLELPNKIPAKWNIDVIIEAVKNYYRQRKVR